MVILDSFPLAFSVAITKLFALYYIKQISYSHGNGGAYLRGTISVIMRWQHWAGCLQIVTNVSHD